MSREFGTSSEPGYNSPVPTDPGLGPKSSPDVSKDDKPEKPEESGKRQLPALQADSVDMLVEGFGAQRPDRPRIKPLPEATPVPEHVKGLRPAGGSTTHPAMRRVATRRRNLFIALTAVCVLVVAIFAWKATSPTPPPTLSTSTNATLPPPPAPTTTNTGLQIQPIPVENLGVAPTETAVGTVKPATTAKPTVTAKPTTTEPTTTTAPTTSGPDPKNDVKRTM